MNILGQLQAVDPWHFRDYFVITFSLVASAAAIMAMIATWKKQKRVVSFEEQLVTKDVCGQMHEAVRQRLASMEQSKAEIWKTLRDENEAIRQEMRKGFQDLERVIGRLEGRLFKNHN